MGYRDSRGRDGWHTETNSVDIRYEPLPSQAPQHPIPTMQGAFEESMLEVLNDTESTSNEWTNADALARRRMLLESPEYERLVAGRWKQKPGENFHPLWKLVAQISFGMHLLHQSLAKSDDEVIKILQTHVDEIDGFLERTTEDLELAQRDINERIRHLKLPLEHGEVFDTMLMDRKFRNAILDGNEKIEHIVDRTNMALRDTLKDVRKGFDGTRELARYFRKLDKTWENQTEEHMGVYAAMMGNTEGWTSAYVDIQNKGNVLNESLTELSTIIAELQRRVGIASRKNLPSNVSTRPSTQPSSRVASIYSVSGAQSPMQKPHISSVVGTGVRRHGSSANSINERYTTEKKAYTGDRYRNQSGGTITNASTMPNSRDHSRRGSDESGNRRVSFTESKPQTIGEPAKRKSAVWGKRGTNRFSDGFGTSWFRKSVGDASSLKDKRKSASTTSLDNTPISQDFDGLLRSSSMRATQTVVPTDTPQPSQAVISQASPMPHLSESIAVQSRRPPRESVTENILEEVTEEEEVASEEEPEIEIVEASKVESTSKDNLAKEITIPAPASPTNIQKPALKDLPLRDYEPSEPVPDSPPRLALEGSGPSLTEAVTMLKRSSTFHGTERMSAAETPQRTSDLRPEPLRVQRVSSFEPFDNKNRLSTLSSIGTQTTQNKTPGKRPANLKLFPTIAVSPGPQTAPLASTKPLYSPALLSPDSSAQKTDAKERVDLEEELPKPPRTPAERGRSPPPPERVPTPLQEERQRNISPSLRALTSATLTGPPPEFPYGFGADPAEGPNGTEPVVAELGPGRRTADGSRASTPEHAELGADSPAARHTPKAGHSPFIDPEQQREELEARKRDRELREEEQTKKVQQEIVHRIQEETTIMEMANRDVRHQTGNTTKLHGPPQVSPPVNGQPPKHTPLSVPLEHASPMAVEHANLPFSKHNTSRTRDLKSLLKRFFRIGKDKDRKQSSITVNPAVFERPPKEKRGFSLSMFGLGHRRKRSRDQNINIKGGLQPFGMWRNTSEGMSWGDTRRGSNGHMYKSDAPDTETDDGSPDVSERATSARGVDITASVPGASPRPQQGTMDIPGVGQIDWNRASSYMNAEKQRQLALHNILNSQGNDSVGNGDNSAIPPVPPVPNVAGDSNGADEAAQDHEDDVGMESGEEDGYVRVTLDTQMPDQEPGVQSNDSQHESHTATSKEISANNGWTDVAHKDDPAEDEEANPSTSEEASPHPSPKPESPVVHSVQSEHSRHSQQSEQSETTGRTPSLAASSLLARKSDATPTTGLSLQFSSPLTSEIFAGGANQNAYESKLDAIVADDGTEAGSLHDAATTDTQRDDEPPSGLHTRTLSSAGTTGTRSPALGADRMSDPMDRAGSLSPQSPQAHESIKSHGRESLGITEGQTSPTSKDAASPASVNPPRTSSLGHTMLHDASSDDDEETESNHLAAANRDSTTESVGARTSTSTGRPASSVKAALPATEASHTPSPKVSPTEPETTEHTTTTEHEGSSESPTVENLLADTEAKPTIVVLADQETVEQEPSIRVDEVVHERQLGNGTPF